MTTRRSASPPPARAVVTEAEPVEVVPEPTPNGAPAAPAEAAQAPVAPPPAPGVPGPRAPKRVRSVEIPEYPGFQMTVWVNYPSKLFDQMIDGNAEDSLAAANQIFIDNNGWCDDEGQPYPAMHTQDFWDAIPNELAATMIAVLRNEVGKLPNSLLPRRAR